MDFSHTAIICMDYFAPSLIAKLGQTSALLPGAVPIMNLYQQNCSLAENVEECSYQQDLVEKEKSFCNKETQTDPVVLDYTLDRQNFLQKIQILENKINDLELQSAQAKKAVEAMKAVFSEGQIRKIMSPGPIFWKWTDISSAICLQASGPRAYNHLYKKGFPLPSISTLQRWCRKVNVNEGVLKVAIDFMGEISDLEPEDKICVLAFDEMKVVETFEYDEVADAVRTPSSYVQVVMARGLKKSWKQPVFYGFDCSMTPELIATITAELHKVGFPVVAIV